MPTFFGFLQILGLHLFKILNNYGNPALFEVVTEVESVFFGEPAIVPLEGEERLAVLTVAEALSAPAFPTGLEGLLGVVVMHELLERIADVG